MPPRRKKKGGGRGGGSAQSKIQAYFDSVANGKLPTVRWSLSNIGSLEASTRDERSGNDSTAFHIACMANKPKSLSMLVDFYARARALREKGWVNLADAEGRTPIMVAAALGNAQCVDILLNVEPKHHPGGGEALLAQVDSSGKSARDLAVRKQKTEIVELIDYFLAPEEEEEEGAEEKVGRDGLTATQRKARKQEQFQLSEREQAAENRKKAEQLAAEKRNELAKTKPDAVWPEVKKVEESVENLKPLCEISVVREDADEFANLGLVASPIDPSLWFCHTLNRVEIRLPKGVLTSIPGAGLSRLENMQTLILSHNSLAELPAELGSLKKLKILQIAGNALTSLPTEIGELAALETLDVADNKLGSLAALQPLGNIVTLLANGNELVALDLNFSNMKRLVTLEARGNPITELPDGVGELSLLQHLGVAHTAISELPKSAAGLKKLKTFDLEGLKISNPKVRKKVAGAAEGGKGLKELLKVLDKFGSTGAGSSGESKDSGDGKKKKKKKKKRR